MCSYTDIFIVNPLKIRLNSVGRGVETVQSGDKMATAELGGGPGGGGRGDGVAGWQQLSAGPVTYLRSLTVLPGGRVRTTSSDPLNDLSRSGMWRSE